MEFEGFLNMMIRPETEVKAARQLAHENKFDEALGYLDRMLGGEAKDSSKSSLLACKGDILKTLGRTDEAIGVYQAALQESPAHYQANFGLAQAYIGQGKGEQAVPLINTMLSNQPSEEAKKTLHEMLEKAEGKK